MSAFDALEKRILDLSLGGAQDLAEQSVVVGLFTSQPAENHDGTYGKSGEPQRGAAGGTGYQRAQVTFAAQSTNPPAINGAASTSNTNAVTITGLKPGTYTHFGIFGGGTRAT